MIFLLGLSACGDHSTNYTLYRNSRDYPQMRIHVGSFDAAYQDSDYNRENCNIAADLFQAQRGVKVKYWCEKGDFRG